MKNSVKDFQVKNISDSVLDVDDASRRVKVVLSKTEVKDHDNDVIAKTAFDKTLKERGPKGKQLIWHLTDHNPSLKSAVGKFSELYMDGYDLVGITNIPNTTWGNDVLELYKSASINQHSIGFKTIKESPVKDDKYGSYNYMTELMKFEGSAVLWGANEFTPTLSVGKSLTKEDQEKEYFQIVKELSNFTKLFSKGHFSDETFELIEIRQAQLTTRIKQLFDNLSESTTEPIDFTLPEKRKRSWNNIPNFLNLTAENETFIYQPAS